MDDCDRAAALNEVYHTAALQAARREIPIGEPGVCRVCDEHMPRLVNGRCAPCRDGRPNPRAFRPDNDNGGRGRPR